MTIKNFISAVRILLLSLAALALFYGCGARKTANSSLLSEYYAGYFHYDTASRRASFTDCNTGVTMPLREGGCVPEIVKEYLSHFPQPGQEIFVEFTGYRLDYPENERVFTPAPVLVDSLVGFKPGFRCNMEFLLPGIYRLDGADVNHTINLKPDYTYMESYYGDKGTVEHLGYWHLCAPETIILKRNNSNASLRVLQVHRMIESLTEETESGIDKIFSKVYL